MLIYRALLGLSAAESFVVCWRLTLRCIRSLRVRILPPRSGRASIRIPEYADVPVIPTKSEYDWSLAGGIAMGPDNSLWQLLECVVN